LRSSSLILGAILGEEESTSDAQFNAELALDESMQGTSLVVTLTRSLLYPTSPYEPGILPKNHS
jgi:hypothetical protein